MDAESKNREKRIEGMETTGLIQEVYTKCLDGLKRIDLENDTHIVKGYWAGTIIRIDIKEKD